MNERARAPLSVEVVILKARADERPPMVCDTWTPDMEAAWTAAGGDGGQYPAPRVDFQAPRVPEPIGGACPECGGQCVAEHRAPLRREPTAVQLYEDRARALMDQIKGATGAARGRLMARLEAALVGLTEAARRADIVTPAFEARGPSALPLGAPRSSYTSEGR